VLRRSRTGPSRGGDRAGLASRACGGRGRRGLPADAAIVGRVLTPMPSAFDAAAQEADAVEGDRLGAGGLDVAPDGRSGAQVAQREPEAFDRQPSVVADGVERREHVAPRDVARSRRAAVVLARVHVTDVATARAERLSEMLLLDVRV